MTTLNTEILEILRAVKDPEIPVLSVVDMGVIREIIQAEDTLEVVITPTYTGCPAMDVIAKDIKDTLQQHGFAHVKITTALHPAWTTAWITPHGRQQLEDYGIAPPVASTADKRTLFAAQPKPRCPLCKSKNTQMVSVFGSTACKAQYKCLDCLEPFDYFKCI